MMATAVRKFLRPQVGFYVSSNPTLQSRHHCCSFRKHLHVLQSPSNSRIQNHVQQVTKRPLSTLYLNSTKTIAKLMHSHTNASDTLDIMKTPSSIDACDAIVKLCKVVDMQNDCQRKVDEAKVIADSDEFSLFCQCAIEQINKMSDNELCSVMQAISSIADKPLWPSSIIDALYVKCQKRVGSFDIQQLDKFAHFYATFDVGNTGRYKGSSIAHRFSELLDRFSADNICELVTIMDSTRFLTTAVFKVSVTEKVICILQEMLEKGDKIEELTGEHVAKILRWTAFDLKQSQSMEPVNKTLFDIGCQLFEERIPSTSANSLLISLMHMRRVKPGGDLQKAICQEAFGRLPTATSVKDIGCNLYLACFDRECVDKIKSNMMGMVETKIAEVLLNPEYASLALICFVARVLKYEFAPKLMSLFCNCINEMSTDDGIHRNTTQVCKFLTWLGLSRSSARAWDCFLEKYEEIQKKLYNPMVIVDFLICQLQFPNEILNEIDIDLQSHEILIRQINMRQMGELVRQISNLCKEPKRLPWTLRMSEMKRLRTKANYQSLENIQDIQSVFHLAGLFDFVLRVKKKNWFHDLEQIAKQAADIVVNSRNFKHALLWARLLDKNDYLDSTLLDVLVDVCAENIELMNLEQISVIGQAVCFSGVHISSKMQAFLLDCADQVYQDIDNLQDGKSVALLTGFARNLSYAEVFPEQILLKIFSAEFLEKIDDLQANHDLRSGIKNKAVKDLVHLNRSVVLECPELQVPWFSENSCRRHKNGYFKDQSSFQDVEQTLSEVLGGNEYLRSAVVVPYGIRVSFEVILDPNGCPLPITDYGSTLCSSLQVESDIPQEAQLANNQLWDQDRHLPVGVQRIAVDYLNRYRFPINAQCLLGPVLTKKRQLEILGYSYIQIPYFEWEELPHNQARVEYLQDLIFQRHGSADAMKSYF